MKKLRSPIRPTIPPAPCGGKGRASCLRRRRAPLSPLAGEMSRLAVTEGGAMEFCTPPSVGFADLPGASHGSRPSSGPPPQGGRMEPSHSAIRPSDPRTTNPDPQILSTPSAPPPYSPAVSPAGSMLRYRPLMRGEPAPADTGPGPAEAGRRWRRARAQRISSAVRSCGGGANGRGNLPDAGTRYWMADPSARSFGSRWPGTCAGTDEGALARSG